MKNILILLTFFTGFSGAAQTILKFENDIELHIVIHPFDPQRHQIDTCYFEDHTYICRIDNSNWFGGDHGTELPKYELVEIMLYQNNKEISLDVSQMFNPTFSTRIPKSISEFKIVGFDASGNLLLKGKGKCIFWNPKTNEIEKEVIVSGALADIDHSGNMLQLDGNYFQYYRADLDSISYRKQHPDWPYFLKEQDTTIRIPLQLSLTEGVLTDKYIFTAGIDRSIRKWNKLNGDHLQDLLKHKATISSMSISPDQSQLVSVDLKGGVVFTKIPK